MADGSLVVIGGQWGDEGKGKVVDLLSADVAAVVRYNGGHNAGHTVKTADRHVALHLIPSGIVHERPRCVLGAAMVIDPTALLSEVDTLAGQGIEALGRLTVSDRAALILPTHRALDAARERALGSDRIGTTGRGIGPAYEDAARRRGLRAGLLTDADRLAREAAEVMGEHVRELERLYDDVPVPLVDEAVEELRVAARRLADVVGDAGAEVERLGRAGEPLLFEGAQGVLLDLYHGTYPFVTSSSCLPAAAAMSLGVDRRLLGPVVAVTKAYVTRVGAGPFPTEISGGVGDRLRSRGNEFGTTTGRPRRCGWFDAVAARHAVRVAGVDGIALTKLDVLDAVDEISIAVRYRLADGSETDRFPADAVALAGAEPVYETVEGWHRLTSGVTDEGDLPEGATAYVRRLEELLDVPVVLISTGPRRGETLVRGDGELPGRLRDRIGDAL